MNKIPNTNIEIFFAGLHLLIERYNNIMHTIESFANSAPEYFSYVNFDKLPNISKTLNNKIVEIEIFYKEHNLSFYNQSPLSHIILCDLCSYVTNGFNSLDKYLENSHKITYQGPKNITKKSKQSKEQSIFITLLKLISNFKTANQDKLQREYSYTLNLVENSQFLINDYLNTDTTLSKYSLDKDLSNSILKFFMRHPNSCTKSISHNILTELNSLHMISIVPNLHENFKNIINDQDNLNSTYVPNLAPWITQLPQPLQDAFRQTDLQQHNISNTNIISPPPTGKFSLPSFDDIAP